MGSYSFKSSGTTAADTTANKLNVTPVPIGPTTPLSLGNSDLLTMTTDMGTALADNLRNLILTNWGERLGFYDFGANLRPLMTNLVSQDDFDSSAISNIRNAVQRWMPYIDLQSFVSHHRTQAPTSGVAAIQLVVTYNIPSLNITGKQLQVTLYAI